MENIRDKGNPEYRAEQVKNIVSFLGQVTTQRVMPQKTYHEEFDDRLGWDSCGDYHDPRLRYE